MDSLVSIIVAVVGITFVFKCEKLEKENKYLKDQFVECKNEENNR